jgi:hypothetical protein
MNNTALLEGEKTFIFLCFNDANLNLHLRSCSTIVPYSWNREISKRCILTVLPVILILCCVADDFIANCKIPLSDLIEKESQPLHDIWVNLEPKVGLFVALVSKTGGIFANIFTLFLHIKGLTTLPHLCVYEMARSTSPCSLIQAQ